MIIEHSKHIKSLFQHCKVHKIFGTAGSGKTTLLLNKLEELFDEGIEPKRIGFVSFTNKAVNEIADRCVLKFPQYTKMDFVHFRTIHSMSYRANLKDEKTVIQYMDLLALAKSIGMQVSSFYSIEEGAGSKQGDKVINIEALARLKMISIEDQWQISNEKDCPLFLIQKWHTVLSNYKKANNLIDFTDMLEQYNSTLDVDYLFIDEAQDLCPLQWEVMNKASKKCKKVFIAGDDDQSIFNWAGAVVDYFLDIKTDDETILSHSYRLPSNIYELSRKILMKIKKRKPKECLPVKNIGQIKFVSYFYNIKFEDNQKYLILVRNRWQIKEIEEYLQQIGRIYFVFDKNSFDGEELEAIKNWIAFQRGEEIEQREYRKLMKYSSVLKDYSRMDELPQNIKTGHWTLVLNLIPLMSQKYYARALQNHKIGDIPKIRISTIHQAKGGEEDNVIVLTDVSYSVWNNINSDNEHKVWYVAVTRAKKNLFIVKEQTQKYYHI